MSCLLIFVFEKMLTKTLNNLVKHRIKQKYNNIKESQNILVYAFSELFFLRCIAVVELCK